MVDDGDVGWEMCEEREGEEGRGAGQNDVLDHAYKLQGDLSAFLRRKMIFHPRNALRSPPKLLSIKLGQGWGL